MTDRIEDITRAVVYEIITAMGDDGLEALLTADDLLASMAYPLLSLILLTLIRAGSTS